MSKPFSNEDLQLLTSWDTPTICNGLEIVCPERRATGFTTRPLVCLEPEMPPVIGLACTARIRAHSPTLVSSQDARQRRLDYYQYIAESSRPGIVVIEDLDDTPGIGAFWGEVQTNVHKGFGLVGGVTNGSIRDLPDAAPGFQLLAGNVGPSHAHVHLVDFDTDVTVHNMSVSPGNVVHADCHGAVVIPDDAVKQLPAAIELIAKREAKIISAAQADGFNFEKLKAAMGEAEDIH